MLRTLWRPALTCTDSVVAPLFSSLSSSSLFSRSFATNIAPTETLDTFKRQPKPPRPPSYHSIMKIVREEEYERMRKTGAQIDDFRAGDQISCTIKLKLDEPKCQVIAGTVIARTGTDLNQYFFLINNIMDVFIERRIPLCSPFIQSIKLLKKGPRKKKKYYYLRDMSAKNYKVTL